MAGRVDAESRTQHVVDGVAALDRTLVDDLLTLCDGRAPSDAGWREASRLVELAIEQLDGLSVGAAAG
jgi:hypothetical protein